MSALIQLHSESVRVCCFMVMASRVFCAWLTSTTCTMAIIFFISDNLALSGLIHRVNMPDIAHFNPLHVAKDTPTPSGRLISSLCLCFVFESCLSIASLKPTSLLPELAFKAYRTRCSFPCYRPEDERLIVLCSDDSAPSDRKNPVVCGF